MTLVLLFSLLLLTQAIAPHGDGDSQSASTDYQQEFKASQQMYRDTELGLSAQFPADWSFEPRPKLPDLKGSTTFFLNPTSTKTSIAIGPHDSALPEEMSLYRFTELNQCSTNLFTGQRVAETIPWTGVTPPGVTELIYVRGDEFQYAHLLRGKVVWVIAANFGVPVSAGDKNPFIGFVSSLSFENDSPISLAEIYRKEVTKTNPFPGIDSETCQPFDNPSATGSFTQP